MSFKLAKLDHGVVFNGTLGKRSPAHFENEAVFMGASFRGVADFQGVVFRRELIFLAHTTTLR